MTAVAVWPSASQVTSIYNLSHSPSFSLISMRSSLINCLPCSKSSGERSFNTSSLYSLLPMRAPNAMAMGRPIMPVPGIPTPMAFFRMLPLRLATICSGCCPNCSLAFAVQRATAIGSVQPMAGTTSCWTRAIMRSRVSLSIISPIRQVAAPWHCGRPVRPSPAPGQCRQSSTDR